MKKSSILCVAIFSVILLSCAGPREALVDTDRSFSAYSLSVVNSKADELAPVLTEHGLYFVSDKKVRNEDYHRIYLLPDAAVSASEIVTVNIEGGSERAGAMHIVNSTVLFGQCYRKGGIGDCDLYEGQLSKDGSTITDVRLFSPPLNDIEWDHHPTISPDGRTLIFASERIRGIGGSDLYMSKMGAKGWLPPVLLPERINTRGNEITPAFSADGKMLYFASDGRNGYGGFDLYVSEFDGNNLKQPKLLPKPFNSEADDMFLCGGIDAEVSYLSSNRKGSSGGYDIYRIERIEAPPPPPEIRPVVLRVRAVNAFTGESIPADISISDAKNDVLLTAGVGSAETVIGDLYMFSVSASHSGYMNAFEEMTLSRRNDIVDGIKAEGSRDIVERKILLTPVTEEERKIFAFTVEFDFDLSFIRPEEEKKLDSAAVLLELYPNSTVVISGHTDSVGTEAYNIKLGHSRATEVSRYVRTYLQSKNVLLRNPMEIRTYGKARPIASNETEEGRQKNRRVEIAIVRNE